MQDEKIILPDIRKIRSKLPKGYTKLVQSLLREKNLDYSLRTIQAVASGTRNNHLIATAIVELYKSLYFIELEIQKIAS